jgi:spermidine synthase
VGLGGGTIPGFLHKHYPQMKIDVVDIDPDVVDVAKRFFGFREDATLRAYVKDGRRFIETSRTPYDVIFLDAFGADNIPYDLATREFLQSVRRALGPKGVAVGNVWNRGSNSLYDSMVRTYQEVFDELYVLEVRGTGNEIFLALPRREQIDRDELTRRAARLSEQKRFRFDLGELVARGYRHEKEENARGKVLTDKNKPAGPAAD